MKHSSAAVTLLVCFLAHAIANPTGGSVASGTVTIHSVPGTTTITQTSNAAIINWQSFSISHGESTQFLQPSAQSAVLNRVLGGGTSQFNGTLSANGQLYLINQNGILVGPGGLVNASGGFTASTRDIADSDFLKGNKHFTGHDNAGVQNAGQVTSALGDVVLIGKTVANKGKIKAQGTVGLVVGDDVLLGQQNADGSTITVNPSPLAKNASGKTGVSNSGSILGAAAELNAANGNIYSMAINNGGTIRASTVDHQGGHIWLSSDSGSIVNSGTLNASATLSGGNGGSVVLKSSGTASHTGTILAEGGTDGAGGNVDISGSKLNVTGAVNLTAPGGETGNLLIDPASLQVIAGGTGTIVAGQNNSASTIDPSTVDSDLNTANLILNADNSITITNGITWTSGSTLTLSTNVSGSAIALNAPISGVNGALRITTAGAGDFITPSSSGGINVSAFILASGYWKQNANGGTLASFAASNDFEVNGSSTFLRVAGGTGATGSPFQITDIYGLQGIGSPSNNLFANNYLQTQNINASGTATWNGGLGFLPIGNINNDVNNPFTGSYNGGNYTVSGLTVDRPTQSYVGLFGNVGNLVTLQGVGLVGVSITGSLNVGGLVGYNAGTVETSYSTGGVNTSSSDSGSSVGGLVGINTGTVKTSYATGGVNASSCGSVGGLVGTNASAGTVETSYATGAVHGLNFVGGLAGANSGTVENSYATGTVNGSSSVGGLAGSNSGTLETSYATGAVLGVNIGGLVGFSSSGTVQSSYWLQDTGINVGLYGIGSTSSNAGATPETLAALKLQSTYASFNFSPGGVWGINRYTSSEQLINNGLPYFQWQYPVTYPPPVSAPPAPPPVSVPVSAPPVSGAPASAAPVPVLVSTQAEPAPSPAPATPVFVFNPALHNSKFDALHDFDHNYIYDYYFVNAKANAVSAAYTSAYVLKYTAAQQNAHANAYDYAYGYAYEYFHQIAKANAYDYAYVSSYEYSHQIAKATAHYQAVFGQ